MQAELSDAELDELWQRHLDGHPLPANVTAHATIRGPQLIISLPPAQTFWTRQDQPRHSRAWHKVLVLG